MGYAEDDVQDALNKQEPSAIKDAYMIVRENQMMSSESIDLMTLSLELVLQSTNVSL